MLRKWGTIVLLLLATPLLALAQNTGKLAGTVMDASTGEPLPGANVVLQGTQLGTVTDVDGNYFIIGVPVGSYDVQASFVGFTPQTVEGVEINAGYTRELNFDLSPGVELDEIVVQYERPLIQKDAIGVPNVTSAEEIQNLPVRGVANVAALQGGVVKSEGSSNLYVRGGREQDVVYYVDGVKVVGSVGVPTQAVQEQEMLIGSIPAKYGDAMSGVISITTKTGAQDFFGSVEAITSEVLDPYGYNNVSATLGGPLVNKKVSFFLAGEYNKQADSGPRAIGFPQLSSADLEFLNNNPQVVEIIDADGNSDYVPFPGGLGDSTSVEDALSQITLPEGASFADSHPSPISAPSTYTSDMLTREDARPNDPYENLTLNGNVQFSPVQSIRLRLGGSYDTSSGREFAYNWSLYAPERFRKQDRDTWRGFASWTQYLSNSTFYQVQVDYSDYKGANYHPDFSSNIEDILFYGDIDHPANAIARRYKQYDADTDQYVNVYEDGSLPTSRQIQSNFAAPGVDPSGGFTKWHYNRFGLRANATTQLGLHQLEFGGEYEQQTQRYINIASPEGFAKYFNDGNVEGNAAQAVDSYDQLDYGVMKNDVFYYGYNYLGTQEVDGQDLNAFYGTDTNGDGERDSFNRDMAPYEPIYYAGYISDKIEYRDLVLQLGLRVDVFDNNTLVLRDPYAMFPIVRAGEAGNSPTGIESDYAVYFDQNGGVVGYRDLEGNFYSPNGQTASSADIKAAGTPKIKTDANGNELRRLTDEVFTDYEPQVTVQPRIGVSFPVTDQALFFASYDVTSQRPSQNRYDTIQQYQLAIEGSKLLNNPDLKPEKTTNYELGFRQRIGARAALQISGFYRKIEDLISRRVVANVYPNNYQTYENVDFGTVKGVELEVDIRRTRNISANVNYTLSFAQGTGSDPQTTSQIVWRQEQNPFYPRFIAPLAFDQRHKLNITLDYRLGEGEGPAIGGTHPLANFGVNMVANFGSGFPYTAQKGPHPIWNSFILGPEGGINQQQQPASALVNLRVDRRFSLGGNATLTAFLWVQNLFNSDNVVDVYNATGLADNDGFLDSDLGRDEVLGRQQSQGDRFAESFVDHYNFRQNDPFNFGIPRQTRLGLRFNF